MSPRGSVPTALVRAEAPEYTQSARPCAPGPDLGALGAAAPILESISNPSGGAGWSWVGCGCQKDPISDQIPTCLVPRIGGIKLQLLCGVRIEPA